MPAFGELFAVDERREAACCLCRRSLEGAEEEQACGWRCGVDRDRRCATSGHDRGAMPQVPALAFVRRALLAKFAMG
jgi:hypothetical protein